MASFVRRVTVYAGFAVATALAAVTLLGPNLNAWSTFNYDPQGSDQELEAWLTAASFAVTSGTLIAQLGSLLFGWYAARTGASRSIALAGGLGLAAVQLAAAVPLALSRVDDLWMVGEMTRHGHPFERDLWQQPQVLTAMLVGALSCAAWGGVGFGVARPARRRILVAVLAVVAVPLYVGCQGVASTTASWWPAALGVLLLSAASALLLSVRIQPRPDRTVAADR